MDLTYNDLPKAVSQLTEDVKEIKRLMLLEKSNEPQPQEDKLLTIQEASVLLNLSVATLYGYSQRAEIPVCKQGKRLYFSKQSLFDWIKQGRKLTLAESSKIAEDYLKNKKGQNK